ncbi:MAG TPA: DNA-formamidopyrimidine glycosylase family protein [Pseudolysinimonas sp.]|nr:DNA-formamidopyrimidine glycosylase family protein [Pseudolysinimonas sp.]
MPEGHSVHRIARQFALHFTGVPVSVTSPQGRFAADAALLDGHTIVSARAVGKQMFLEFDHGLWLRVHLGLYGAWDFAGDVSLGRHGETLRPSMGAPRLTRLRMSEQEKVGEDVDAFPPDPIGQVRVRLLTPTVVGDLRGPTACEVQTGEEVQASIGKLGPDPLVDDLAEAEERFVWTVRKKPTPIALLLMDQSVVGGIGNVYRAELLFRARQNPFTPGREVREEVVRALWLDWVHLLRIGFETGLMYTMDDEASGGVPQHWVYKRTGEPCLLCGTPIQMQELGARKLYWCPTDQA